MFEHHTKTKGDLGLLKVKLDLFQKGFLILNPETEHAPFDIVAYQNQVFKRVQVKYKSGENGSICVNFRSSYCNSKGVVSKPVDKSEIDIYAVYCEATDLVYYFNPNLFEKSLTLRVDKPKNNQSKNIHFAEDFLEVP